jgi:hypothetical protein
MSSKDDAVVEAVAVVVVGYAKPIGILVPFLHRDAGRCWANLANRLADAKAFVELCTNGEFKWQNQLNSFSTITATQIRPSLTRYRIPLSDTERWK